MKPLALCFALLLAPISVFAQWSASRGPNQAVAWDFVALDTSKLLIATVNGLYVTADTGRHWEPAGLQGSRLRYVAHLGPTVIAANADTVWRSMDRAQSWSIVWTGTRDLRVASLLSVRNSFYMLVQSLGTRSPGAALFRSNTYGSNWQKVAQDSLFSTGAISIVSTDDELLLQRDDRLFASADGDVWTSVGLPDRVERLRGLAAGEEGLLIAAGDSVYWRAPRALIWRSAGLPRLENTEGDETVRLAMAGNTFVVAHDRGVNWISFDAGEHWRTLDFEGFSGVEEVYWLKAHHGTLVAGTQASLHVSPWKGRAWLRMDRGLTQSTPTSFARHGATLFTTLATGIAYSNDEGKSWKEPEEAWGLADSNTVSFFHYRSDLCAIGRHHSHRLTDVGWVPLGPLGGRFAACLNDRLFYAPASEGLLMTTDPWKPGTALHAFDSVKVTALYENGGVLFAAGERRTAGIVFRSTDAGEHWQQFELPSGIVRSIIARGTRVFAAGDGLWRSDDDGESWVSVPALQGRTIEQIVARRTNLVAIARDTVRTASVLLSLDGGQSWFNVTGNLPNGAISAVSFGDSSLLVGLKEGGIWSRSLEALPRTAEANPGAKLMRVEIYPGSGGSPSTAIHFFLDRAEHVRLLLQSAKGDMLVLRDAQMEAGDHRVPIDYSQLPSGIYRYVLEGPGYRLANPLEVP